MKQYRNNRMELTSGFVSSNSSSDEEGFEEQKIKIKKQKAIEIQQFVFADEANDLLEEERPTDFKPRTLLRFDFREHPNEMDSANLTTLEPLTTLQVKQAPKLKKFRCLRDKYEQSQSYKLVYSKLGSINKQDYLNSFLNLNQTVDFNPSHYHTFSAPQGLTKLQQPSFDSNFESGNLLYVYQATQTEREYDLILQNDYNTKGYNQWFYFKVNNAHSTSLKFNIVNLVKKRSLFTEGVRPMCYSFSNPNWQSCGTNINYYKSMVYRQNGEYYYTLSFELQQLSPQDTIFIALNTPYTYSRMIKLIQSISSSPKLIVEKCILCYSISNNAIPYLKIRKESGKRQILVMARQHPGETVSSFVLESFLRTLMQNQSQLFEQFEFVIIPMVNPDGVIYGNFRTNLSGFDLNRQWLQPNRWLHPEIYFIKKLVLSMPNLAFVLDLHGHSKKFNSFIYACKQQDPIMEKYFPFLMEKCPIFNIRECTYGITMDKTTTARATVFSAGIKNVYTLETSFYGYTNNNSTFRLSNSEFDTLACSIISSLERFFLSKESQMKQWQNQISCRMSEFQHWQQAHNNDSGSQSNPSEDELSPNQRQEKVMSDLLTNRKIVPRKKKKKKKVKRSESKLGAATGSKHKLVEMKEKQIQQNLYQDKWQNNVKTIKNMPPIENQTIVVQRGTSKKKGQQDHSQSPNPIYNETSKQRAGLFRQKDPKKTYFPSTQPREATKRKSLSNLLVERESPEKVTISHQLQDRQTSFPQVEQENPPATQSNHPSNNRLLIEYNKKMKTRSKLETLLTTNKFQDRINITIGKNIKNSIDKTLEIARQQYAQNMTGSSRKRNQMPSIGIGNFSEQSNLIILDHRRHRDLEPRKFRSLKPVERPHSIRKQHVYLSQLMRPKDHEDSRVVCLKIQEDIHKQMKMRSNSIRDKQVFIDYRTR